MFLLLSVVSVVLLQSAAGDPYCSLSDILIDCVPCSENCENRNQVCYLCPKQCGKTNNCKSVCKPTCRNQTCEDVGGSVPVCTKGCTDGRAGRQCQEHCSGGCKTCDQDTGKKCESCWEGLEGQYCNITILSSQSTVNSPSSSLRCAKGCELCKDGTNGTNCQAPCDCTGLKINSTQFPLTSTSSLASITIDTPGPSYKIEPVADAHVATVIAAAAAAFAVAVVICIATICMYRKMKSRPCGRDRTANYNTDGSSFTYTGYTYIDETNLGSCHDRTNVMPINVPRCSGDNYYEEMGSGLPLSEEDNGSDSSLSVWSGTLFGNLFGVDNESDTQSLLTISEGQLNENAIIGLVEVYEMNCLNYITPEVTIDANQGVSDV